MSQVLPSNEDVQTTDVLDIDPQEAVADNQEVTQEEESATQELDFDPKERVEINDPKVQRKFNDIYKQMKMSDARGKMKDEMLAKAMEKIQELESRFAQTDQAEAERILNTRLKEARDSGDEEKADQILQEIINFKVDSKIKGVAEKVEKPKQQAPFSDPDVLTVVSYAEETDESGNLLRPWINASHPDHNRMMKLAGAVAVSVHAELGETDLNEVFRRMDEMAKQKTKPATQPQGNSRAPDPMRGNLTNNPAKSKMKLSDQELAIAQKLGVKPEHYLRGKQGWKQ